MKKIPELLMPAGSPDTLAVALDYGADAVYLGSEALSLRAKADNFDDAALKRALALCHGRGKKLYLAVNIFAHQEDLREAEKLFREISSWDDRPDAFIISDLGIFRLARRYAPAVPVHISTQANSTNAETFLFWYELGVRRIVCARELSLDEIKSIREAIPEDMEIEVFVHGSMCISYSGRCLISNYLSGRDANRGLCTQPCRFSYRLEEASRPGEYMPVQETEKGTYIFNSKDLCMIHHLPQLIEAGAVSLKVEGRMKNELYAAVIARAYRRALDALKESEASYEALLHWCLEEIYKCTTREYCTGFYFGRPNEEAQHYPDSRYRQDYRFLGVVKLDEKGYYIRQKNKFYAGEEVEAVTPSGEDFSFKVEAFETEEGIRRDSCPHPGEKLYLHTQKQLQENIIIREKSI